jgi:hypothetical protein
MIAFEIFIEIPKMSEDQNIPNACIIVLSLEFRSFVSSMDQRMIH